MRTVYINKSSALKSLSSEILIFLSIIFQFYYFFGYTDQGQLYEIIKGQEALIYIFNAAVYIYLFWKLCNFIKNPWSAIAAVITSAIYMLHTSAYRAIIRVGSLYSPKTISELRDLLFNGVEEDVLNYVIIYILLLVLMLVITLFIAVITPKTIKHKLHVIKKKRRQREFPSTDVLVNLPRKLNLVKALGNKLVISDNNRTNTIEYFIELEIIDFKTRTEYLVFTSHKLNKNNAFIYYVGMRDRENRCLVSVDNQEIFDKIENLIIRAVIL